MEILDLIDRAESIIGEGMTIPLAGKVIVDRDRFLQLIDQMRVAVPDDIKEAQQIIQKRDSVVNQAVLEAKRIVTKSQEEAHQRVQESVLVKEAEKKAADMLAEANRQVQNMVKQAEKQAIGRKQEANQYTLSVLHKLDEELTVFLKTIHNGIESLEKESRLAPPSP